MGCIQRLAARPTSRGWENSRQAAASSPSSSAQGQHQHISCWLPAHAKHTGYKLTALQSLTPEFLSPVLQPLSLPSTLQHRTLPGALGAGSEHPPAGAAQQGPPARAQRSVWRTHHQGEGFPCDHPAFGRTGTEPSPRGGLTKTHYFVMAASPVQ